MSEVLKRPGAIPTPEQRPEPTVIMPTSEDMTIKLANARLLGISPGIHTTLKNFINYAADRKITGGGIWALLMLGQADHNRTDYSRFLSEEQVKRVIDTVTPDPKIAERAKSFYDEVYKELKERQ